MTTETPAQPDEAIAALRWRCIVLFKQFMAFRAPRWAATYALLVIYVALYALVQAQAAIGDVWRRLLGNDTGYTVDRGFPGDVASHGGGKDGLHGAICSLSPRIARARRRYRRLRQHRDTAYSDSESAAAPQEMRHAASQSSMASYLSSRRSSSVTTYSASSNPQLFRDTSAHSLMGSSGGDYRDEEDEAAFGPVSPHEVLRAPQCLPLPDFAYPASMHAVCHHPKIRIALYTAEPQPAPSGPAPLVVMIAGYGGWSIAFRHVMRTLSQSGCKVVSVDLLSTGCSDRVPATLAGQAEAVRRTLTYLVASEQRRHAGGRDKDGKESDSASRRRCVFVGWEVGCLALLGALTKLEEGACPDRVLLLNPPSMHVRPLYATLIKDIYSLVRGSPAPIDFDMAERSASERFPYFRLSRFYFSHNAQRAYARPYISHHHISHLKELRDEVEPWGWDGLRFLARAWPRLYKVPLLGSTLARRGLELDAQLQLVDFHLNGLRETPAWFAGLRIMASKRECGDLQEWCEFLECQPGNAVFVEEAGCNLPEERPAEVAHSILELLST